MAAKKTQCHQTFESGYSKSCVSLLYGGMRKKLFVDRHPLDGVSSKHVGLAVGKGFYDLNKQELEVKDSIWRVKANFSGTQLFNLKLKLGAKTKGETRNNIQFGTDQSDFGSDRSTSKMSVGGMFTCSFAGVLTSTRLKIFNDRAVEAFSHARVGVLNLGCDMRVTDAGDYKGFVGGSFGFPAIAALSNVHVGGILALPTLRPSAGIFAEVPVPAVQKVVLGVEFFDAPRAVLAGAEAVVDNEHSVIAKVGDNGVGQISVIKRLKGLDLRVGFEANALEGSAGRFGVQVTLK